MILELSIGIKIGVDKSIFLYLLFYKLHEFRPCHSKAIRRLAESVGILHQIAASPSTMLGILAMTTAKLVLELEMTEVEVVNK
ncbi:MAG: hypothetical protein AAB856_01835 [Patescibacteria group bacterium]